MSPTESVFSEAIQEIHHELVPIKARGMTILRNLILSRDPIGETKFDVIAGLFLELLEHDDRQVRDWTLYSHSTYLIALTYN